MVINRRMDFPDQFAVFQSIHFLCIFYLIDIVAPAFPAGQKKYKKYLLSGLIFYFPSVIVHYDRTGETCEAPRRGRTCGPLPLFILLVFILALNYTGFRKKGNIIFKKETAPMADLGKSLSRQIIERTQLDAIRSLMETMSLTVWQAMEALKIPEDVQSKYASILKEES